MCKDWKLILICFPCICREKTCPRSSCGRSVDFPWLAVLCKHGKLMLFLECGCHSLIIYILKHLNSILTLFGNNFFVFISNFVDLQVCISQRTLRDYRRCLSLFESKPLFNRESSILDLRINFSVCVYSIFQRTWNSFLSYLRNEGKKTLLLFNSNQGVDNIF